MVKTVKEAKADIFLRDTDSQSLFNNSGVLSFKYYHEWNDCYNQVTGETAQIAGEVYDDTTNSYKPNCPEGFSPVFNGRQSALWDNIVNCFPNEVEAMYAKMRGNGLTYQDMLTKYKDFWKCWCENLYNADAFGYANTNNFTKAYGDKVQVMDYFYGKRQRYLDSKYHCGSSVGNNLRLRLYEVGRDFAIKHYQAIYCTLQWGVGNFDDHRNIKPGTYSYMPFKFSNPQDATFDIDDADLITELSTYAKGSNGNYTIYGLEGLGDFKFDLNMGLLKRLTKFVMNYTVSKPNTRETGTSFDLSNMGMLRQVIVRNVKNLKKSIILSSDLLEEIDFTNTPITGVTTPPTDMLTKLVLPATIKELNLVGYTTLQVSGLQVAGYSNIETLRIENCPNLDSYEIAKACYDAGAKLSNVTLTGIDWNINNVDFLMALASKKAKLSGKITIQSSVNISLEQHLLFRSAWGDVNNTNNSLYIDYKIIPITEVAISGRDYIGITGKFPFTLSTKPVLGNNISSVSWEVNNEEYAIINSSTGELEVKKIGTKEDSTNITITATVKLITGKTLVTKKQVYLHVRPIKVGDYLFSDFTYGSKLSDSDCKPMAIVFYIDPTDNKNAIAVSPYIFMDLPWGLSSDSVPNISLLDNPKYSVYDIDDLANTNAVNVNISQDTIIDTNTKDGFKSYNMGTTLGDIGFLQITASMYNSLKKYMDKAGLKSGDKIAIGQLKTFYIIKHRDTILADSAVLKPIPEEDGTTSEIEYLRQYISDIINTDGATAIAYYYPLASYCYAYEYLDSKGAVGHNQWFLGASGEITRLQWYLNNGFNYENNYSIFSQAVADGVWKNSKYILGSSSEANANKALILHSYLNQWASSNYLPNKSSSSNIYPMISFKEKAF